MITVLQRQNVTRRPPSPVATRARSNGVRWSNSEIAQAAREHPVAPPVTVIDDAFGVPQHFLDAHPAPARRPRAREIFTHSFLQRQSVQTKRRAPAAAWRERRAAEKRWARIIQKAAQKGPRRPPGWLSEQVQRAQGAEGRSAARRTPRAGVFLSRAVSSPWAYIVLACLAGLLVAMANLGGIELSFSTVQKPQLPQPQDVDPVLYNLLIPDTPATAGTQVSAGTQASAPAIATLTTISYRTQSGDTLSRIAARFHLNVDTVVSWNGIRDGRNLSAGTQLAIPNADGLKYVVRRGDTLQGISRSWGVDFNGVLDWNRLASSVISVGQELFLPGARMNPSDLNRILGSLFMYPVQGRISSYFGERPDPFTGVPNYHNGVDIVNRPGTPIEAASGGTIADVGFNYNYGNYVIIRHPGGYQTLYGHLTRYVVTRGEKVLQGEKIGELGTTGYSTGPHLHFSIFRNGQPVDPLRFLK